MPRFRLLAVDLDGTLLDSSWNLPEVNLRALESAARAGVVLAIVTGRRFPAASACIADLSLDPWLVLNGGALVKEGRRGPVVARNLLPIALARQVLSLARPLGAHAVVHDGPDAEGYLLVEFHSAPDPSLALYLEKANPPVRRLSNLEAELVRDPVQVMFAATLPEIADIEGMLRDQLRGSVHLARTVYPARNFAILDVLAGSCSKAQALAFLIGQHGFTAADTMAIGDNWNDLEMLESAGLGVVMGNAEPELRARGFALTSSNDAGGVAEAIERYLL
jgi:hypothetical protein